MKAPRTRLAQTIADRSLKGGISKQFSREVAAYLLSEQRVNELDSVLRDVQADWVAAGHIEVLVRSAHPLDANIKREIERVVKQRYPKAKRIVITEITDPSVIGSVRLNLANQQLDLSIEAQLNKFKQLTTGKD